MVTNGAAAAEIFYSAAAKRVARTIIGLQTLWPPNNIIVVSLSRDKK